MTTQTELFPKTTMEVLESLRAFHVADVEKDETALENLCDDEKIARRYEKAEERLAAARDLVRDIDRAIAELRTMDLLPAIDPATGESVDPVAAAVAEMKCHAEEAGIGVSLAFNGEEPIVITKAPEVNLLLDPITGEVAPAVVFALYPGDDEPHATPVGDRTRYGELVADYFTAAGLTGLHEAKDWTVIAETGLAATDGQRKLRDIIDHADYGRHLAVVRLVDVQEANELLEDAVR